MPRNISVALRPTTARRPSAVSTHAIAIIDHPDDNIPEITYTAFVDPAGGSGADSFTLAIAHTDFDQHQILDAVREQRPPFSPESTVADFAVFLKTYRVSTVIGDRYAGEWPREQFRKHGITYQVSDKSKSDIYRDVLPLLNSRRVELLDLPRLLAQLATLERRTARGGRDSVDHAPGAQHDIANAVAGVFTNAAASRQRGMQIIEAFTGDLIQGVDASGVRWLNGRPAPITMTIDEFKAREARVQRHKDEARLAPPEPVRPLIISQRTRRARAATGTAG